MALYAKGSGTKSSPFIDPFVGYACWPWHLSSVLCEVLQMQFVSMRTSNIDINTHIRTQAIWISTLVIISRTNELQPHDMLNQQSLDIIALPGSLRGSGPRRLRDRFHSTSNAQPFARKWNLIGLSYFAAVQYHYPLPIELYLRDDTALIYGIIMGWMR